ncbi:DUF1365 family protein [Aquincola sp. MAHUQ-54]|uniref:DUF1365 family protein n=1 Tax=Aquincola agrisoli TaxID=3119538 RepID=A0AAW9QMR7_9BURK
MSAGSALYTGVVTHQRLRPMRHRLRYRVYSLLLDVDELPALSRRLRLFSLNRFNLFSLHERDHGDGSGLGLRAYVEGRLHEAGIEAGGAIRLLTMPRILGYAFNPLSVYFCDGPDGTLRAILYEVNNTFGQRHSYLIEVDEGQRGAGRITQGCAKQFHVSPFLGLAMGYRFDIRPPKAEGEGLRIGVTAHDDEGPVLVAHYGARRRPLGDAALARVFLTHPLLTLKVIAAIHWEALRLWAKGARVQPQPAAPARPVTVIKPGSP